MHLEGPGALRLGVAAACQSDGEGPAAKGPPRGALKVSGAHKTGAPNLRRRRVPSHVLLLLLLCSSSSRRGERRIAATKMGRKGAPILAEAPPCLHPSPVGAP